MKTFCLFSLAAAVLLFTSCQKEITGEELTTPGTPSSNNFLVKTYTETVTSALVGTFSTKYNLSYDTAGRILSLISTTNAGDKLVYQYSANQYTMDIFVNNSVSIHETFFIGANGLVDSTLQYNDTRDTTTEKYIYDTAKRLTQLRRYDVMMTVPVSSSTTDYVHDTTGNIIRETEGGAVTTYEFYPNLLNDLNVGQVYFFRNRHLTKTTMEKQPGLPQKTWNHTYTFDSLKRITQERMVADNGDLVQRTYTY